MSQRNMGLSPLRTIRTLKYKPIPKPNKLANCSRWQTMSDRPTTLLAKTLRWKKRPGNQNRIKMRMFNKVSMDMKKRKFSNSNLQLQKLNKTSRKIIISKFSMKRTKLNNLKIRHRSFKKKNHSWRNLNYMRKNLRTINLNFQMLSQVKYTAFISKQQSEITPPQNPE